MIEHCVWIKFRSDALVAERCAVFDRLAQLVGQVPGLLALRYGSNARYEALDQGFSEGFIAVFEDAEALARYRGHPEHIAAGEALVSLADGGLKGLLVFDLETQ